MPRGSMYKNGPCRQILAALALSWPQIIMVVSTGFQMPSLLASRSGLTPPDTQNSLQVPVTQTSPDPSVLYVVSAPSLAVDNRPGRVRAILDTWGHSGKVIFLRNEKVDDSETRWGFEGDKFSTEPTWRSLLERALDTPGQDGRPWDWVMHVADVTVVIDRNLKNLLMRYNHSQPYTIGSRLRLAGTDAPLYYSGGPGFVLSRGAVSTLLKNWYPGPRDRFRSNHYDIRMLNHLAGLPGVKALDGLDEEGGQLFNLYSPAKSFHGRYDSWYLNYKKNVPEDVNSGMACCARFPVSFHYVSGEEITALYDILNNRERWEKMSQEQRLEAWPHRRAILGHSKGMVVDDPAWKLLLDKFRVHK